MGFIRAFFLAPFPAAVIIAFISVASGADPRLASVLFFYLLLLYAVQLTIGAAIAAFLIRTDRVAARQFALGGLAMTGIPTALYLVWALALQPGAAAQAFTIFVLWSLLGSLTGVCFWWIAQPFPPRK